MATYWVWDLPNIKGISGHLLHPIFIFANGASYAGLQVRFWVAVSIQKVVGYFHFISPLSCLSWPTNIWSSCHSIQNSRWNVPVADLFWQPCICMIQQAYKYVSSRFWHRLTFSWIRKSLTYWNQVTWDWKRVRCHGNIIFRAPGVFPVKLF